MDVSLLKRQLLPHQDEAVTRIVSTLLEGTLPETTNPPESDSEDDEDLENPPLPRQVIPRKYFPTRGFLLHDEPGLGKTTTTLATLVQLRFYGALEKPVLVTCPTNCVYEWNREIEINFEPGFFDVRIYKDSSTFEGMRENTLVLMSYNSMVGPFAAWVKKLTVGRIVNEPTLLERYYLVNQTIRHLEPGEVYNSQFDISINKFIVKTSKRFATKDASENSDRCGVALFDQVWGAVIMDEAQKVKSKSTATTKCLAMVQSDFRIALSGTPIMNDAVEIHNIMRYGLHYGNNTGWNNVSSPLYHRCTFGRTKRDVKLQEHGSSTSSGVSTEALEFNVIIDVNGFPWDRQLYLNLLSSTRNRTAALAAADALPLLPGETKLQRAHRIRAARNKFFNHTTALQLLALHRDVYLKAPRNPVAGPDDVGDASLEEELDDIPLFPLEWTYRTHREFPRWFRERVFTFLLCMHRMKCDGRLRMIGKDMFRMICTHFARSESGLTQPSPKLLAIHDIYMLMMERDPTDKMVVMSSSRKFLEGHVMPYFNQRGVGSVLLCGSTVSAKQKVLNAFEKDPTVRVMCAVKSVAGVGLNLQHGSATLVLCEPGWNDAVDAQAVSRIDRTGQMRTPHIYRLLWVNSVDTAMMKLQEIKRTIADSALYQRADMKVAKVLSNLIDMNPQTALTPRPGDQQVNYNQGFLSHEPVRKKARK